MQLTSALLKRQMSHQARQSASKLLIEPTVWPVAYTSDRAVVLLFGAQKLCESRGGRSGLPVRNSPYGLCGRKATLNDDLTSDIQSSGAV